MAVTFPPGTTFVYARGLGFSPNILVPPGMQGVTETQAEAVLAESLARGYTSIILVTSKYHTRRAAAIYRFLSAGKMQISVRAARDDDFHAERWWRDRLSARRLIIEYEKWISFVLVDRWRFSPLARPKVTSSGEE